MELIFIAIRNILRNRRRSLLTMAALTIGVAFLFLAQGLIRGFSESLYENMTVLDTGHVQIEHRDYRLNARRLPLDTSIAQPSQVLSQLQGVDGVAAIAARIDFRMELTNGVEGVPITGRAIQPTAESEVTGLRSSLKAGTWLIAGQPGLVIGSRLASKLGLKIGDSAYFTALDRHSVRNLGAMPVVGIFESGYTLFDERLALLDLDQASQFLAMESQATRLAVRAKPGLTSEELTNRITAALAGQTDLRVLDWKIIAETLVSTIQSRLGFLRVVLIILFALIVTGIVNTMNMAVRERFREIGTLRAIGMRRSEITRLLLLEGLLLGVAASMAALIIGGSGAAYLQFVGFDIKSILPADLPMPFGSRLTGRYVPLDFISSVVAGLAAAVGGSFAPARKAGRIQVREALADSH